MATEGTPLTRVIDFVYRYRGLLYPVTALALVLVLLVPLPTSILDVLLVANITLSAIVLLTVMYMNGPLEFSSFPSLLLSLTLLRLVLNTATTRLILTNADGTTAAAGRVIEQFSAFVAAGSLAVGVIIFIIITIIQFVVITKGATRIAEVAARFTLDAMPGKQMAIDADLSAGLVDEAEARRRRETITQEADFYGAMDGASKFVRGDAIAGLIITIVNIVGGIYVGMIEVTPSLSLLQCLDVFTKLTIGDGLVSQIPAFLVSIAAGMIITRSTGKRSLGEELMGQLFSKPIALLLAGGFLTVLLLTPLPKIPLLLMGGGALALGYFTRRQAVSETKAKQVKAASVPKEPERIETCLTVDPLELEVGYGLIRLVDRKQGGDLLERISNVRRQIATDLGIIVPPIRIRDNVRLEPNGYTLKLRGAPIAKGELLPGYLLAIDSGAVADKMHGIETREPAFGLPAVWIGEDARSDAEHRHYTVVDVTSVLATHLTELIQTHAAELLTRQDVGRLLDNLKERSPKVVEEVVPEQLKIGEVQAVLERLLRERVPIRDLEIILEALGDWVGRTKDPDVLAEYVRNALARMLCERNCDDGRTLHAVTLDPGLEDTINSHVERSERGAFLTIPPAMANRIVSAIRAELDVSAGKSAGAQPILLTSPQVRQWVRRLIETALPKVAVLGYNEVVRGIEIRTHGMVAITDATENIPSAVHV